MQDSWVQFADLFKIYLAPFAQFLRPLATLVIGWLLALAAAAIVRQVLRRTQLDNRLAHWIMGDEAAPIQIEKWAAKGVYYLLMLFVLVAFFQTVGLKVVTDPLNQILFQIFEFAPRLLSTGLLLLLAWILASVLRLVVSRVLTLARVEERLGEPAGIVTPEGLSIPQSVGNVVYWLIFLIFLPTVLEALGLEGLLLPVREMLGEVIGFLPNLFAGGLILLVGWFAARIVQRIVTNLLAATGVDRAGEGVGLDTILGQQTLSGLAGVAVYGLILILTTIAALDTLQFAAISNPASQMLTRILNAIPLIFTAGLVLLIAYLVGRFIAGLITELLTRVGFNTILTRLEIGIEPAKGQRTPSEVVGTLALVATLLFAFIEAARLLGFEGMAELLLQLTGFAGHVILGLVIFGIGLYLAGLAAGVVRERSVVQGGLLSMAVRVSIVTLSTAIALRQMGLANEIINMAFSLLLGAIAVAVALAFGLGSRDIAAREVENWLQTLRGKSSQGPGGN